MLVEPYLGSAFSSARLITGSANDANDAVQEAMLSAWRGLRNLRDASAFEPWFRRQVVRAASKVARRARRALPLDTPMLDEATPLDDQLAERTLARSFARVSSKDRVILVLHYHLGLSSSEIGAVLNVPPGTVKSRVHYAIRRLRAAYEGEERA